MASDPVYPVDHLLDRLGGDVTRDTWPVNRDGRRPWEMLGIEHHRYRKMVRVSRARGGFTHATAEKYAVAAGYHPESIWPGWIDRKDCRETTNA